MSAPFVDAFRVFKDFFTGREPLSNMLEVRERANEKNYAYQISNAFMFTRQTSKERCVVDVSGESFLAYRKFVVNVDSIVMPDAAPVFSVSSEISCMEGISCYKNSCYSFIQCDDGVGVDDNFSISVGMTIVQDFDPADLLKHDNKKSGAILIPNAALPYRSPSQLRNLKERSI